MSRHGQGSPLSGPWRSIHGAIWLIGLAILFWKGWFWPGILFLIAASTILEVIFTQLASPPSGEQAGPDSQGGPVVSPPVAPAAPVAVHRSELLPSVCPTCGAPVRAHEVRWTGAQSADCPYCGSNLPMAKESKSGV